MTQLALAQLNADSAFRATDPVYNEREVAWAYLD